MSTNSSTYQSNAVQYRTAEITQRGALFSSIDRYCQVICKKNLAENAVLIHAELENRYNFNDTSELEIELKNGPEILVTKTFELEKFPGKKHIFRFDLTEQELGNESVETITVFAKFMVKSVNYLTEECITEVQFTKDTGSHDVVLVVGGKKFYMVKYYLAVWSRFFDRLFFGSFKEANQYETVIEDVDANEFETLMYIIYPSFSKKVNGSNVACLMKLADRFEIPRVLVKCEKFLFKHGFAELTLTGCLELAEKYNIVTLQIKCFESIHSMSGDNLKKFLNENRNRLRELSPNTLRNLI